MPVRCKLNKKCFETIGWSMKLSLSKSPNVKDDVIKYCWLGHIVSETIMDASTMLLSNESNTTTKYLPFIT